MGERIRHDLTYKPSGRTSQELIDNFNLLGDTLAKLDQQSDLVRRGIEREAAPREQKQRELRRATILMQAQSFSTDVQFAAIYNTIIELGEADGRTGAVSALVDKIYYTFDDHPKILLSPCAITDRTQSEVIFQQTLEAVDAWLERLNHPIDKVYAQNVGALISFCGGDLGAAIEFAEQGATLLIPLIELLLSRTQLHQIRKSN